MTIESAHDHPITGPVVIVHSKGPLTDGIRTENPMHAFGPFPTEEAARLWAAAGPDDDCHQMIIDIFDPWESRG